MLPGERAVPHIGKHLVGEGIARVLPRADVPRETALRRAADPVPDVHVRAGKEGEVLVPPDHAAVLVTQLRHVAPR